MRARVEHGKLSLFNDQDSSFLSILSDANALLVVPPNAPQWPVDTPVEYIPI
jgi:molybdopterin molybdotransferase